MAALSDRDVAGDAGDVAFPAGQQDERAAFPQAGTAPAAPDDRAGEHGATGPLEPLRPPREPAMSEYVPTPMAASITIANTSVLIHDRRAGGLPQLQFAWQQLESSG